MYVAIISFFGLIFVLSYGTNILSLMGETAIYDTKGNRGSNFHIMDGFYCCKILPLCIIFGVYK